MQWEVGWDNDSRTVVRYTYSGNWSWEDYYLAVAWRDPEFPAERKTYAIVDVRAVTRFPADAMLHFKKAAQISDSLYHLTIIIAKSQALIFSFNLFVSLYSNIGKRFRLVTSEKSAYALIDTDQTRLITS